MNIQKNYVFKLSLKDIALRRVIISVCFGPDILPLIEKFHIKSLVSDAENQNRAISGCNLSGILPLENELKIKSLIYGFENEWCKIVGDEISGIISKLLVPESVKQIGQILQLLSLQIIKWKAFHENYLTNFSEEFGVPILSKLCWTYIGTVDYRKTAEALLLHEMLDAVNLYKLACLYCLEDYIPIFWEKLPEEIAMKFSSEEIILFPRLHILWPYILRGEHITMLRKTHGSVLSFNQQAFLHTARHGNRAATEYFFRKLTEEEKGDFLLQVISEVISARFSKVCYFADDFPSENFSDVLFYLLSQTNNVQQISVFKKYPAQVLCCFLDWPLKDLFMVNEDQIWVFLSENCYSDLLSFMRSHFICFTHFKFCFPSLFQELFTRSPDDFKRQLVLEECQTSIYFHLLLDSEDKETIKVIFRELDYTDRVKLLSSSNFFVTYCRFILNGKSHMVKVCLEEAMLFKEDMKRLENAFLKFLMQTNVYRSQSNEIWTRFRQLLDANDESKRNSEVENQSKAKKFRNNT